MGRGLLKFKGDKEPLAKKKKSTKNKLSSGKDGAGISSSAESQEVGSGSDTGNTSQPNLVSTPLISFDSTALTSVASSAAIAQPVLAPKVQQGTGKITTSGTVVMGHGTLFQKELQVGDAVVVMQEMRVVKMRLSDVSIGISSAFSKDLISPTSFQYINKPKNEIEEERKRQKEQQKLEQEKGRTAFGDLYDKHDTLVYREKSSTGTSYVIKKEQLGQNVSRSELLNMRSKKKSDKYCN